MARLSFSVAKESDEARFRRLMSSYQRREVAAWVKAAGVLVCVVLAAELWWGLALAGFAGRLIAGLQR